MAVTTFGELLSSLVRRRPGQAALIDPATGATTTFGDLDEQARRVAGGLAAAGIAHGDRVAVWLPNIPEWLVAQFAAARLGAIVVAVNTRFRAYELGELLHASGASCLVMPSEFLGIDFAGILATARQRVDLSALSTTVLVDTGRAGSGVSSRERPQGSVPWRELLSYGPMDRHDGRADDVSNIFTTSGSTGTPKLAMHRQRSIVTHARNDVAAFDMHEGDISLCALPLCGVFGFNAAMSALASGSSAVLPTSFEPSAAAEAMARFGVTHWHAADNMVRQVSRVVGGLGVRLESWREGAFASFSGGGPQLVREVERATPARITGVYGASELFALTSRWPRDWSADDRGAAGGFPVSSDMIVRAVDPESGTVLPHGQTGELQFRGYNIMSGYFGDDEATAAVFTRDGWYRSGDLGYTRDDGAFIYLTRLKESLRLRGFLADPIEIEQFLQTHQAVALAQVVGVSPPDRARGAGDGGDIAVAFVELHPNASTTLDELRDYCRHNLANYKVPAVIHLVTEWPTVDGTNGVKIQKVRLRDRAGDLLGGHADSVG